jgi:hypothetical protein
MISLNKFSAKADDSATYSAGLNALRAVGYRDEKTPVL